MRKYYATGKSVSANLRNKASKKMFKKANQKKSAFGMLSVKAGIDKNPNPTQADRIAGAKMSGSRKKAMGGGMMRKQFGKGGDAYHTTKDGRRVKKGLYYYMNRAKKRGTSRPGKGTVTDKALKRSAKTAKKA
tara:strand:+ start:428 stop:826 length:399 start_codon:yes stop_codon:yes gene_type:complete